MPGFLVGFRGREVVVSVVSAGAVWALLHYLFAQNMPLLQILVSMLVPLLFLGTLSRRKAEMALRTLNETLEHKVRERSRALEERANLLARSESELRSQKQILQLVLDSMADGVAMIDHSGELAVLNPAAERIIGKPLMHGPASAWSENYGVFLSDAETPCPEGQHPLIRAANGETVEGVELHIRNGSIPDGVDIKVGAQPLYDENGQRVGAVAVFRDVTQAKRIAEDLKSSNERFETLAKVTNDVVWDWNLLTGEIWHNEAFYRLSGTEPSRWESDLDCWRAHMHPDDRDRIWRSIRGTIESGERQWQEEYRFGREGACRDILDRGHVLFDASGRAVRMVGVMIDISRLKDVEYRLRQQAAELARSNKDLEQFAYVASHDLKEPLRMVTSFVQMLQRKYHGKLDSDANEYIKYAVDGAARMHSLIDDLLMYSHVDRKNDPFEVTDFNEVLHRVILTLREPIRESKANITYERLPTIIADPVQIGQLLQNLIGNAIKYRKPNEPLNIEIVAEAGQGQWRFSVKDNGIGIAAEFAERIFKLFQRLHTKEEYPGTGIGLAICKRITERHGGRIWVESIPDVGSTFSFVIAEKEAWPSLKSVGHS